MRFVKINICEHCGDELPEVGMTYCSKACSALGQNMKYIHLFQAAQLPMTEEKFVELNKMFDCAMCLHHPRQFENVCGYCK